MALRCPQRVAVSKAHIPPRKLKQKANQQAANPTSRTTKKKLKCGGGKNKSTCPHNRTPFRKEREEKKLHSASSRLCRRVRFVVVSDSRSNRQEQAQKNKKRTHHRGCKMRCTEGGNLRTWARKSVRMGSALCDAVVSGPLWRWSWA